MGGDTPRDLARRLIARRFIVVFVAASLLTFAAEHLIEVVIGHGDSAASRSLFDAREIYGRLVASWPRRLTSRHTVLMTIDTRPIAQDGKHMRDPAAVDSREICSQRRQTAALVARLEKLDPGVIVIDKYYLAGRCEDERNDTKALQESLARASSRIPIVVGLRIDVPPGTKPEEAGVLPLIEPLSFPDTRGLREGIVNLDMDTRRVPLGWHVVKAGQLVPEWRNTLAVEAARAKEPRLLEEDPRLAGLIEQRAHPYVSMIEPRSFRWYRVGDAFCAPGEVAAAFAEWCGARKPDLEYIRGRIVVVGEMNSLDDMHQSVLGRVPGLLLQANYIEALLDDRYFRPAPFWVNLLIGFFFFVAVELSLAAGRWWLCLLLVALSISVTFVMLSLIVRYAGFYVNPVTFSALVLGINLVIWLRERFLRLAGGEHA